MSLRMSLIVPEIATFVSAALMVYAKSAIRHTGMTFEEVIVIYVVLAIARIIGAQQLLNQDRC